MAQANFNSTNGAMQAGRSPLRLLNLAGDFKRSLGMLKNPRVPLYLKLLLPLGAALYWIWPIDLMPGLPIDDIAVLLIALRTFVALGEAALNRFGGAVDAGSDGDKNTVDGSWRVVE